MRDGAYVVASEAGDRHLLRPLLAARKSRGPVRFVKHPAGANPSPEWWSRELVGAAALLCVGSPTPGGDAGVPDSVVRTRDGAHVPVGWLPRVRSRLIAYAERAAAIDRTRADSPRGPFLLLGQWDERALSLADEIESVLRSAEAPVFRWTAERVLQARLRQGLGVGAGLALYVGHSFHWGWAGYLGFSAADLVAGADPIGAVLSIGCDTARIAPSLPCFAEELVLSGTCMASLGATVRTLHAPNRALARTICSMLCRPDIRTLADLVRAIAASPEGHLLADYRITGDPLAPLAGAATAAEQAALIPAPAPDEPPPPLPPELWPPPPLVGGVGPRDGGRKSMMAQ